MQPSAAEPGTRRRQLIAIGAVLLVALVIALVSLGQAKPRITGNNGVSPDQALVTLGPQTGPLCVSGVSVPPQAVGVRLGLVAHDKASSSLSMTTRAATGGLLGVSSLPLASNGEQPIFRLPAGASKKLTLCWRSTQAVGVLGSPDGNLSPNQLSTLGKAPVAGDISIEYMHAGKRSALAMASTVFERASLFRPGWFEPWVYWIVFGAALFALLAGILILLAAAREGYGLKWRVLAFVGVIAFVNAVLWALVTPAFNTPDEYAHFTYVETLASGQLPDRTLTAGETGNAYQPSSVLASTVTAGTIIQHGFVKQPWSRAAEQNFYRQYDAIRAGPDQRYGKTPADVYTPAYYAPAAAIYRVSSFGNIFDRLLMVRLYSALLFAFAAIFCALFVRELLPGFSWAVPVAGLAIAFEPMAAHIGGGVSNDNLMVAACAAALWLGARVLRRGVTFSSALATLLVLVLAYAAKPTAIGIAPAIALAFMVAIWRSKERWPALRTCLLATALPLAALATVYLLFGGGGSVAADPSNGPSLRAASPTGYLSYLWQWYVPGIGPLGHDFGHVPPVFTVFLDGFIANFNSLDTRFSGSFYMTARLIALALFVLGAHAVWKRRERLTIAWPIVAYPLIALLGTAFFVNTAGYFVWTQDGSLFAQGRYLFPALAVFALFVAAAGVGAGKKYGLALASAVVVALACTNIAGMVLSLGRFYL